MIRLPSRPLPPASLTSLKVAEHKRELAQRVHNGERLESKDFRPRYWSGDVRETLWRHHREKCCYCERKRDQRRESDVEHFRPKSSVAEDGEHPGYWWLAYEWENLFFSCKACNEEFKKTQFPVDGDRTSSPDDDLQAEAAVLIDPVLEDPSEFIGFAVDTAGLLVKPVAMNTRGLRNITILGLDRPKLVEERAEALPTLQHILARLLWADCLPDQYPALRASAQAEILEETSADRSFAGFRRSFFQNAGKGHLVATD